MNFSQLQYKYFVWKEPIFSDLENVIPSELGFQQLANGHTSPEKSLPIKDDPRKDDNMLSKDDNETKLDVELGVDGHFPGSYVPLTQVRLAYLLHLLDSVKKFV